MKIGLVKEIKTHEYRVGLTPNCVEEYVKNGHTVYFEKDSGIGAGFENNAYINAGGIELHTAKEIFDVSEMIVKVKEPLPEEYHLFKDNQILYTYLHLAAQKELANILCEKNIKSIAYETITDRNGQLPCLVPMSEIAGRLATQEGAKYLEKPFGGRGVLLGGVSGVARGNVVIIGAGVVGMNACKMAVGLGANVTVLDINAQRLAYYDDIFSSKVNTLFSNKRNIIDSLRIADLVIGTVLLPGAAAPKIASAEDIKVMKKGSVIVDVSIDQGGCFETSKVTYHDNPTYKVDDVVHYCVGNMPGAVPLTSTLALTSITLSYGLEIANKGLEKALQENSHLLKGLNTYDGFISHEAVAKSLEMEYKEFNL